MDLNQKEICAKFGADYIASERTFKMGIDLRITKMIADRFKNRRVLETCTGAGFTTIALARKASYVVTVEIDTAHLEQARQNVHKAGLLDRVKFLAGDVLDNDILNLCAPFDAAFLDPDWADSRTEHVYKFRQSNTQPPADTLLERIFDFTSDVAIVLPPHINRREFKGLPENECQEVYLGGSHELYCLYFGGLARSYGITKLEC
jgi:tRNA1(Val) A37 N6-methylase TrmN6